MSFVHLVKAHAARVYAVAVAVLALVAHFVPSLPSALVLGVVAAVLGAGEAVHRVTVPSAGTDADDPYDAE